MPINSPKHAISSENYFFTARRHARAVYRRCPCKPSYVTQFSKMTFLHKSIEGTMTHLLSKRQFFLFSGNMIFLTVSKPRMSTQVRLVRAIPRIYLVCVLRANAVAAKPRIGAYGPLPCSLYFPWLE